MLGYGEKPIVASWGILGDCFFVVSAPSVEESRLAVRPPLKAARERPLRLVASGCLNRGRIGTK